MKIAFDAKRAYQNETGLGNYSRTLIASLANFYPQHSYYLCAPKLTDRFDATAFSNVATISPLGLAAANFTFLWRSSWVKKDLLNKHMDVYHGLSNEVPLGIGKTNIKSVVTIHDLIFERYPHQYSFIDTNIYRSKFKYACKHADKVIATSRQTKDDIINYYKIAEEKIDVCYQSCNPAFAQRLSTDELKQVKHTYNLPDQFFLYVGSVIERKNLLNICKALYQLRQQLNIPLVVIGSGGKYKQKVQQYVTDNNLQKHVIFLSDQLHNTASTKPITTTSAQSLSSEQSSSTTSAQSLSSEQSLSTTSAQSFQSNQFLSTTSAQSFQSLQSVSSLSGIYQLATCLIYPSVFEGFGIPVLEALWSRLPVITSNISCMPETGGDAAIYIDPYSVDELATAMLRVATNQSLQQTMKEKGWKHAQNFTPEKCAAGVMNVYMNL